MATDPDGARWARPRCHRWVAGLLLTLFLASGSAQAFVVEGTEHRWQSDASLLVRLDVALELPEILRDAIANGIAVQLVSEVRLEHWHLLRGNRLEASASRSFRLHYSALSRHYVLTDLDRGRVFLAPTLGDALDAAASRLGRLVVDIDQAVLADRDWTLSARVLLDPSALPLPLQWNPRMRQTYLSGGGWLRWPLR